MVDPTPVTPVAIALAAADPNNVGANLDTVDAEAFQLVDSSNGNMFVTTGKELVLFRRTDSGEAIITVASNACDQGFTTTHNMAKHIQAGSSTEQVCIIGPFSKSHFGQLIGYVAGPPVVPGTKNEVVITYSGTVAATKIAVVQFQDVGE
jgi:hypothetical protein